MDKKKRFGRYFVLVFLMVTLLSVLSLNMVYSIQPFGANVTEINSSRAPADDPQSMQAQAGNVTEMNIFGYTVTQSWQGYYGNVSGAITLADGNDQTMYNWSLASPQGEIYASTDNSVNWGGVSCFNMSNSTKVNNLESSFGIEPDDVDGVNETFSLNDHEEFYTANKHFSSGQCSNTKLYNSTGQGVFDEILLYDETRGSTIFTSLLKENANGFDNRVNDFEMLVLEDGHGTDTSTTPYYFYVELE